MYSENSISKKLRTYAENNGWVIKGGYIYGDEQGVLFSGLDGKGVKTFITPVPHITEEEQAELFDVLEKNRSTMKLSEFAITDDFLCIRIKDSMQLKTEDIEFIVALLVGTLQELNITTVGRCQECGRMDANHEHFVFDLYCYMHENCAKAFEEEMGDSGPGSSDEAETDDEAGSDVTADDTLANDTDHSLPDKAGVLPAANKVKLIRKVLFTILGAVVGSIPWLLLPFIMDFVNGLIAKVTASTLVINFVFSLLTCICVYLVPYFAIRGYRLSKARMDIKGRWIVGIVAIAAVVLIQFASIAILIAKAPSVTLTFENYFINISKFAIYTNLLLGTLIGTVFTLISVLPFFDMSISPKKAKKTMLSKDIPSDKSADDSKDESADTAVKKDPAAGSGESAEDTDNE